MYNYYHFDYIHTLFELDMKEACPVISEKLIIKLKQL